MSGQNKSVWLSQMIGSLFAMIFGLWFLLGRESQLQAEHSLLNASGQVAWVQAHRYGVHFAFKDQQVQFNYSDSAGASGEVLKALRRANDSLVQLRYEQDEHGPIYSDERYHDVWQLQVGERQVRSYVQVFKARSRDEALSPWLGGFFLVCGLFMAWQALKLRKKLKAQNSFEHLFP